MGSMSRLIMRKRGRLAAARRADQHAELAVGTVKLSSATATVSAP